MDGLLRTPFLARLVLSLVVAGLAALVFRRGFEVRRHFRADAHDDAQLTLERRAELISPALRLAALFALGAFVLTALGASDAASAIRGAMCAYGVFDGAPLGIAPLVTAGTVAFVASLLGATDALDRALHTPRLVRVQAGLALALLPLSLCDLGVFVAFVRDLDFSVIASCCSVELDHGPSDLARGARGQLGLAGPIALLALAAAIGAVVMRRAGRVEAFALGLVGVSAALVGLLLATHQVAPHAQGNPLHHCPFCLLEGREALVGWPLYAALFLGAVASSSAALVAFLGPRAQDDAAVRDALRVQGRRATLGFVVAIVVALAPIVRHLASGGGATLWG